MRYGAPRKKAGALTLRILALHRRSDHWAQAGASPLHLNGQRSVAVLGKIVLFGECDEDDERCGGAPLQEKVVSALK